MDHGAQAMDQFIARLNIEHFRALLIKETDEAKRKTILRLLHEEEEKLATLESATASRQAQGKPHSKQTGPDGKGA
jgi:hypothetical protein